MTPSATTTRVLLELAECIGEIDDDASTAPRALVAVITREHLELAAINEEPDLDEIVAAVVTAVCVRVAHAV